VCCCSRGRLRQAHARMCLFFCCHFGRQSAWMGWIIVTRHFYICFALFLFQCLGPHFVGGVLLPPCVGGRGRSPESLCCGAVRPVALGPSYLRGGVCLVSATLCCARPSLARASLFACRALLCLLSPVSDFLAQLRRALEICLSVFRLPLSWKQSPDCLDTQPKPSPYISRVNAVSLTIVLSFTTFSSRHFCPLQTVFVARKVG
jgi:hypothetical protein